MAAPPNTTAATATTIGALPYSTTQSVHDAGTTYTVWYAYTAAVGDAWIGVWAYGDLTTYQPTITTWLGPAGAPVAYLDIEATNVPIQLPVVSGTTYYFQIAPNAGDPTPAVLTLSVERGKQYDVAEGSIAINDDTSGFPLLFVDSTTGVVLYAVSPFPAGEAGDILDDGTVAVNGALLPGDSLNTIRVYAPTLTPVGSPLSVAFNPAGTIRAHLSGKFYISNDATNQIRTVTSAGAFGPTTWTTPGGASSLRALAVNLAETRAYYADQQTAVRAVKIWNLTTDTDGGVFHAFPSAAWVPSDILVLDDDSVLIAYSGGITDDLETQVVHLSAAGAVLDTFSYTGLNSPNGTLSRMARAIESGAFWLWTHLGPTPARGGTSRFLKVSVSDGATLASVDVPEFEGGVAQLPLGAIPDPRRFGISYSCPFWITRVPFDGPDGPPPDEPPDGPGPGPDPEPDPTPAYDTRSVPQRRLRRAPHLSDEQIWMFHHSLQVDLETGLGLVSGQGEDPQVMLRWSDDGGKTWSNEHWCAAGRMGEYRARVSWNQLGRGRDRVYEMVVSDAIPWHVVGAILNAEPGGH